MQKIQISHLLRLILFAMMMSFLTSSTVSGLTVYLTISDKETFFLIWLKSMLKSWPLVFFLIIIFVPVLNKLLDFFFTTPNSK